MAKLKLALIALSIAIVISAMQFFLAAHYSIKILWQSQLMLHLVGNGPLLGYRNGQPMYEGTPVHVVAFYTGLILGAAIYWLIGYLFLKKWHNNRLVSDAEINATL